MTAASNAPSIYAIATMDTKGDELVYVAERIRAAGVPVVTVDVGVGHAPTLPADISREHVAAAHPDGATVVLDQSDRGRAVTSMAQALTRFLLAEADVGKVAGVIGIGGSGGTAIVTPAMQALPIGLPKVMVSTMASGNTVPYVGSSDICLLYSVVDIAGLNAVSTRVLGNAAHAIVGMVAHEVPAIDTKPALGMTMFGVTTPCVTAVRQQLDAQGFDCLVFHATGTGGRAMEKLVADNFIKGVLDITTTEVADEVVGGVFPAGESRFDIILEKRLPYVLSLGALDMVNFGALETVPAKFRDRLLHVHNAQVTLMRTSPEENRQFARWIADKVNRTTTPVTVVIPEKGISSLDAPGQAFFSPEADAALFEELETTLIPTDTRRILRAPLHINDPEFANLLVATFCELYSDQNTE